MPDQNVANPTTAPAMDWRARFDLAEALATAGAAVEAEALYHQVMAAAPQHLPAYIAASRCARQRGDRARSLACYREAALAHPTHVGVRMECAADLRALERLAEAEALYQSVIEMAPLNMQARLGLGQCARQRGDRPAAIAVFQAAGEMAPADPWPLLELAADYRALDRWDEAEAAYGKVLLIAGDDAQAWIGLGQCARGRGQRHLSFALFQAGARAAPDEPWALLEAAADLRQLGELGAAEDLYRQALQRAPGNCQALLGLAHCARGLGDRAGAIAQLRAAVQAAPADLWPLLELSADLREMGELNEAEAAARQVLAMAPLHPQGHISLGLCARKRGDQAGALRIFRAAVAAVPDDPWLRLELAADLREAAELTQAEAMYHAVLALAPGNGQALLGLGFCARNRGDRATALARFQEAARANPLDVAPWLEIAVEQRDSGAPDAAIATANRVLEQHPEQFHALLSLGQSERYAGRHEAAFAAFANAQRASPALAEPVVEMAVAARQLGRQAQCDALLAQALALDPRSVPVIVRLAEQEAIAGRHDEALAIYQKAAREQPGALMFQLGAADALASCGRMNEALAALASLAAQRGLLPALQGKWINLLRQSGDYAAALALARECAAALPRNMQLWSELFHTEMLVGTEAGIAACLALAPAATARDQATLHRHAGEFAESCWRFDEAMAHYQAALAADPRDAALRQDLARIHTLFLQVDEAQRHLRQFCALTAYETRLRKKSLNISQTQYGQILDEYRLDAGVLAATRPLFAAAPAAQVAGLSAIARASPDSTAAAVSLLIALRTSGALAPAPAAAPAAPAIPRTLMQYWDTPDPPEDVARLMQSWGQANPGLECRVFNHQTAQAFLAAHFPPPVLHAYRRGDNAAQKSDIFRLAYLAIKGGIYADADDRCLGPLSAVIPDHARLVLYQDEHMTVCNNFICCGPGHEILLAALQGAVRAMLRGDRDTCWFSTGPALLTRAFAGAVAGQGEMPAGTVVLSRRELGKAVAIHCAAAYKRTDRHWLNAAFGKRARPKLQR